MNHPLGTRRQFLQTAAVGIGVAAAGCVSAAGRVGWTIGCLNRPWVKWSVDDMLDGVHFLSAGLQEVVMFPDHASERWDGVASTHCGRLGQAPHRVSFHSLTASGWRSTISQRERAMEENF